MQGEEGTGGQELWPIVGLPLPPHQQALGIETLPLGPSCFPGTWHSEEPSGERALQGGGRQLRAPSSPGVQCRSVGVRTGGGRARAQGLVAGGGPHSLQPNMFLLSC